MADSPKTVLIIDDEFASLEVMALLLKSEGFAVLTAGDGEEALDVLEQHPVNLVVTDFKMPRMDGGELCLRLLADERFRALPVIMASATYGADIPKPLNVVAFFSKPVLFSALIVAVRKALKSP